MSFDNSRFLFDPFKNYSGVVMEQGRVQLDSDWNEWLAAAQRRTQAGTLDALGRAAYPATTPAAFQITAATTGGKNTLTIGAGRMYVDGLLAENHGDPASATWDPALAELSGAPQPPPKSPGSIDFTNQPYAPGVTLPAGSGQWLAYLDVRVRPVTHLQDRALIDDAIGIPTTGRLQTIWQVLLKAPPQGKTWTCSTPPEDFGFPESSGQLTNGTVTSGPSGPCCLTTGTGYTGVENQFYRVEIHLPGTSGGTGATFKWSRENASVQTSVIAITSGSNTLGAPASILSVASLGRDQVLGFAAGNWIEITNDTIELNSQSGELYQVDSVDVASQSITLTGLLSATFPVSSLTTEKNTRICRWDQAGKIFKSDNTPYFDLDAAGSSGAINGTTGIPVPTDGSAILLEGGITVQFSLAAPTGHFLAGDYWTFSARTARGSIDTLTKAPPRGIHHHCTPLSIVTFGPGAGATDCRPPLNTATAEDCGCCSCTVGDGVLSHGKYTSIQAAINALPTRGGEVCILPGNYFEHVVLEGLHDIVIHGCEGQTHIYSPALQGTVPATAASGGSPAHSGFPAVFTLVACKNIDLHSFSVHASGGEVGVLLDGPSSMFNNTGNTHASSDQLVRERLLLDRGHGDIAIVLSRLFITASTAPAIFATIVQRLLVDSNRIAMADVASLYPAVYLAGDDILFEDNWVGIESREEQAAIDQAVTTPSAPKPTAPAPVPVANAPAPAAPAPSSFSSVSNPKGTPSKLASATLPSVGLFATRASSGVQIGGPSHNVFIVENEIVSCRGNGITLGNLVLLNQKWTPSFRPIGLTIDFEAPCSPGGTINIPGTTTGDNPHHIAAGGPLRNIYIDRNLIHNTGMCGIGPVGFFNLYETHEVISIINLSITANIIANTLLRDVVGFARSASPFAYGAITLPDVQEATLRDNTISNFGVVPGAHVCGIFVLHGEVLEISRNQIRETRPATRLSAAIESSSSTPHAGILLLLISPPAATDSFAAFGSATQTASSLYRNAPLYNPGLPALRLQGNLVHVALGLALEVFGVGAFEIIGNHLSTGSSLSLLQKRTFLNQDAAFTAARSHAGALTVMILNLGLALEDINPGYGFAGLFQAVNSKQFTSSPGLATSSSGTVLFTSNVCQFQAGTNPASAFASVSIITLDHLLFASNQLWLDGPPLTALVDAHLFGVTLQVNTNRFQEAAHYPVLRSGLTAGIANITSQNLATYCITAVAPTPWLIDQPNVILQPALCKPDRMSVKAMAEQQPGAFTTKGKP